MLHRISSGSTSSSSSGVGKVNLLLQGAVHRRHHLLILIAAFGAYLLVHGGEYVQ